MSFVILKYISFGFLTQAAFVERHHYTLSLPKMSEHVCWGPFVHIPVLPEEHQGGGEQEYQEEQEMH